MAKEKKKKLPSHLMGWFVYHPKEGLSRYPVTKWREWCRENARNIGVIELKMFQVLFWDFCSSNIHPTHQTSP